LLFFRRNKLAGTLGLGFSSFHLFSHNSWHKCIFSNAKSYPNPPSLTGLNLRRKIFFAKSKNFWPHFALVTLARVTGHNHPKDLAMRTKGKAPVLESIRLKAVALFKEGMSRRAIAKELMVSTRSIYRWISGFEIRGISGVMSKIPLKSSSYLNKKEMAILKNVVLKSPKEFGYCSVYWNALILSDMIIRIFGVHFHKKYIYRFAIINGISLNKRNVSNGNFV